MTDTSTAMVTTLEEPKSTINTTQPPYYYPATGPDARTIHKLTLYVSRQLEAIYLVCVKSDHWQLSKYTEIRQPTPIMEN